jgi:hypothetical protein
LIIVKTFVLFCCFCSVSNKFTLYGLCLTGDFVTQSASSHTKRHVTFVFELSIVSVSDTLIFAFPIFLSQNYDDEQCIKGAKPSDPHFVQMSTWDPSNTKYDWMATGYEIPLDTCYDMRSKKNYVTDPWVSILISKP